jgi:hypothetical protein
VVLVVALVVALLSSCSQEIGGVDPELMTEKGIKSGTLRELCYESRIAQQFVPVIEAAMQRKYAKLGKPVPPAPKASEWRDGPHVHSVQVGGQQEDEAEKDEL